MKSTNKYGAKKTIVGKIVFDSKDEAERYAELKLMQRQGLISELIVHPRYELIARQNDERAAYYSADFEYMENDKRIVEDVKSSATAKIPDYILRRKLFKQRYPDIVFREIIM